MLHYRTVLFQESMKKKNVSGEEIKNSGVFFFSGGLMYYVVLNHNMLNCHTLTESIFLQSLLYFVFMPRSECWLNDKSRALCLLCFAGLERDKFDNKTVSFEEHIKSEHNMWHYLYFLVLVKVKDPTEYTGPESYVAQMIVVSEEGIWTCDYIAFCMLSFSLPCFLPKCKGSKQSFC